MVSATSEDLKSRVRAAVAAGDPVETVEAPKVARPVGDASRTYRGEVALFVRQLAVMFQAGLPLHQAVEIVAKRTTDRKFGPFAARVAEQVEKGVPVWKAMADYPRVFSRLSIALVKAGEESGEVSKTLDLCADSMEFGEEMERRVVNVMLFPLITALVAGGVMVFLLTVIFPSMTERFAAADVTLPPITQFVWGIGVNIQTYWYIHVVLFAAAAAGGVWFIKSRLYLLEFLKLRLPLIGGIIAHTAVARFAKTFSVLLEAGLPVADALEMARDSVANSTIAAAVDEMKASVESGGTMAAPLANHWYIPGITADLIAVGEQVGTLPVLMDHLAKLFEVRVRARSDRLITIIEPVMTLMVSMLVLIVAMAMFMPYFALFTQGMGTF